ncbi:histone acetyltransferase [Haladaptatus pallidirubidus]|uniref:Chromosome partitioning protein ParB n=1 Tax=Haladaptatus pallidirubidus TaxID=1008152 RepID=A0AAV3UGX9_9EURY|nr:hypothetical protein [Haladaptatus pallidirubidus]
MVQILAINTVRPSQLYLSSQKLAAVLEWFDFANPSYDPLPIAEYGDELYLLDGHTRAFVAHLGGIKQVRVTREQSILEQEDKQVYHECFAWCADAELRTVSDLSGRILNPEVYQKLWIDRCQQVAEQLE